MAIKDFYVQTLAKVPAIISIVVLRAVNWLFQGIVFASRVEQIVKIFIDLSLTFIFITILLNFIPLIFSIIFAIIIAHSFNWIFATNIWSTRIKKYSKTQEYSKYVTFLISIQKIIQKQNSIYGAAIFGSMSTGQFNIRSDIDVKLFRKPGFTNLIKSYLFLFQMRTKANFQMFPLDIYVLDNMEDYTLKKDEIPIILYDPEEILKKTYNRVSYFSKGNLDIIDKSKNPRVR